MKLTEKLTLRTKLIVLVALPLLGVFWFGISLILEKSNVSGVMADFERVSIFTVHLSNLVHETQKERGMTAGFIGSQGSKFTSKLPQQRRVTDTQAANMRDYLKNFNTSNDDTLFSNYLSEGLELLDELTSIRKRVNSLEITAKEAISHYTRMNAAFLGVITKVGKLAPNVKMASVSMAFVNFLQGKERAGIERAVLTNTFANNNFGPGIFQKFGTWFPSKTPILEYFGLLPHQNKLLSMNKQWTHHQ